MPVALTKRPKAKQNYVFVTKTDAPGLTDEDHRQIRSQSQLSRWGSNAIPASQRQHGLQSRPEKTSPPGVFSRWQLPTPNVSTEQLDSDDSVERSSSEDAIVFSASPLSLVSKNDPFGAKPLGNSFNELIDFYVNDLGPPVGQARIRQVSQEYRKLLWMPMAMSDHTSYYALLSFLLISPRTPAHLKNPEVARRCLGASLQLIHAKLRDKVVHNSTLYAVGMLELVAYLTGDESARENHHNGLMALMTHRYRLNASAGAESFTPPEGTTTNQAFHEHEPALREMFELGIISEDLSSPFRRLKSRPEFTTLAARDPVASVFYLNHATLAINEVPVPLTTKRADLVYHVCHATIFATSFMSFFETGFRIWKLEDSVRTVHSILLRQGRWQQELVRLWRIYPSVILWIALVHGTATQVLSRRKDFRWLLIESVRLMNLSTYEQVVDLLSKCYSWPGSMQWICKPFWDKSAPWTTNPSDYDSEARKDFHAFLLNCSGHNERGLSKSDEDWTRTAFDYDIALGTIDDAERFDVTLAVAAPRKHQEWEHVNELPTPPSSSSEDGLTNI